MCLTLTTLYNLVDHKGVKVADVWDGTKEEGGWLPIFLRSLNDWEIEEVERFLQVLHNKNISPLFEDKLLLKGARAGGFSMKFMYKVLDQSPKVERTRFSFFIQFGINRPSQIVLFSLGKLL